MLQRFKAMVAKLRYSQEGAEGIEKLLIVGAIVLPLLFVLLIYRNKISEFVSGKYEDVMQDADDNPPTP